MSFASSNTHSILCETLLIRNPVQGSDKITIATNNTDVSLDFQGINHLEVDDVRVKQLTNEKTNADMITFTSNDKINCNARTIENCALQNVSFSGGVITGANLINCIVDLSVPAFNSKIITTDASGTLQGNFDAADIITTDNTATLSYKTIDATCTLDDSFVIGGFTADRILKSDASGNVEASTIQPADVVVRTGVQTIQDKIIADSSFSGASFTNALSFEDGGGTKTTALTLGATKSTFAGGLQVSGNTIESSTATAIVLSGANVETEGTLKVKGNQIKTATGTPITLDGNDVSIGGNIQINNDTIKSGSGAQAILIAGGNTTIANALRLNGNVIQNSNSQAVLTTNSGNTFASFSSGVGAGGDSTVDGYISVVNEVKRRTAGGLYTESDWLETDGTTTTVSNAIDATGDIRAINNSSAVRLKVSNNYGTLDAGPRNAGTCHFDTDRASFYFYKPMIIQGYVNPASNGNDLGSTSKRWSLFADTIDSSGTAYLAGGSSSRHIRFYQDGTSQNTINSYTASNTAQDLGIQSHGGETWFGLPTSYRLRVLNYGLQAYNGLTSTNTLYLNYFGSSTQFGRSASASNLYAYGHYQSERESGPMTSGQYIRITARNGGLTGYPSSSYPTLKTNYANLYFDVGGVYVGYLDTTNQGQIDFTGQHKAKPKEDSLYTNLNKYVGRIVSSTGEICSLIDDEKGKMIPKTGKEGITINEAIPQVELCDLNMDKRCCGVITAETDENNNGEKYYQQGCLVSVIHAPEDDRRLTINQTGEGAIWVCNVNGNIQNGDYITTCDIGDGGYGAKQADDLIHNYTCAKAMMKCTFILDSPNYECIEIEEAGKTYRCALIACYYKF